LSGLSVVLITVFVLRLFVTVSLPVVIGVFAGATLAHFASIEYSSSHPDEANTDTIPTTRH
jgi:MFS superfamily sulfate permease-like transporter